MTGEIRGLTSLRGVAALFVVMYHFRDQFGRPIDLELFAKGYLWVDFFFVLSGFVMAYVYGRSFEGMDWRGYRGFLLKRLARIYPLHLVILLCFVPTEAAKLFMHAEANPAFSINSGAAFVGNLFLVHSWGIFDHLTWNRPSWSISTEMGAYLIAPALFGVFCHGSRIMTAIATAAAAVGLIGLVYGPGRGSLDITYDFGLLRCVFSFAIGMLAYRAAAAIEAGQGARKILASDALWLVCAAAILVTLSAGWDDIWVVPLFWMLVVTTAVNRSRVARALDLQPLYWLGTVSYSVYLTHTLILRGWQLAYQKLFAGVPLSWPLSVSLLAAVTGIVLMVSAATYHWIEVPGRRLISPESWRRRAIA